MVTFKTIFTVFYSCDLAPLGDIGSTVKISNVVFVCLFFFHIATNTKKFDFVDNIIIRSVQ